MTCDLCGQPAMAVAPGSEDQQAPVVGRVARGVPQRAWCLTCLRRVFKLDEAA